MDWLLGLILAMLFYRTHSLNQRIEVLEGDMAEVLGYIEACEDQDEDEEEEDGDDGETVRPVPIVDPLDCARMN